MGTWCLLEPRSMWVLRYIVSCGRTEVHVPTPIDPSKRQRDVGFFLTRFGSNGFGRNPGAYAARQEAEQGCLHLKPHLPAGYRLTHFHLALVRESAVIHGQR